MEGKKKRGSVISGEGRPDPHPNSQTEIGLVREEGGKGGGERGTVIFNASAGRKKKRQRGRFT